MRASLFILSLCACLSGIGQEITYRVHLGCVTNLSDTVTVNPRYVKHWRVNTVHIADSSAYCYQLAFGSLAEAEAVRDELQSSGYPYCFVVAYLGDERITLQYPHGPGPPGESKDNAITFHLEIPCRMSYPQTYDRDRRFNETVSGKVAEMSKTWKVEQLSDPDSFNCSYVLGEFKTLKEARAGKEKLAENWIDCASLVLGYRDKFYALPGSSLGYEDPKEAAEVYQRMLKGDFDGDGRKEFMVGEEVGKEEGRGFKVQFPGSDVAPIFNLDWEGPWLLCEGDLDGDGADELSVLYWGEGAWGAWDVYTYKENQWRKVVTFSVWEAELGDYRVRKHPDKEGYILISKNRFDMETGEIDFIEVAIKMGN